MLVPFHSRAPATHRKNPCYANIFNPGHPVLQSIFKDQLRYPQRSTEVHNGLNTCLTTHNHLPHHLNSSIRLLNSSVHSLNSSTCLPNSSTCLLHSNTCSLNSSVY